MQKVAPQWQKNVSSSSPASVFRLCYISASPLEILRIDTQVWFVQARHSSKGAKTKKLWRCLQLECAPVCSHLNSSNLFWKNSTVASSHTPTNHRKRKWSRCFERMRFYHAAMTPGCSGTSWTSVGVDTARAALPKSGVESQEETKKNRVNFKGVRRSEGMNRCHWLSAHSPTHIIISEMFSL